MGRLDHTGAASGQGGSHLTSSNKMTTGDRDYVLTKDLHYLLISCGLKTTKINLNKTFKQCKRKKTVMIIKLTGMGSTPTVFLH